MAILSDLIRRKNAYVKNKKCDILFLVGFFGTFMLFSVLYVVSIPRSLQLGGNWAVNRQMSEAQPGPLRWRELCNNS